MEITFHNALDAPVKDLILPRRSVEYSVKRETILLGTSYMTVSAHLRSSDLRKQHA